MTTCPFCLAPHEGAHLLCDHCEMLAANSRQHPGAVLEGEVITSLGVLKASHDRWAGLEGS